MIYVDEEAVKRARRATLEQSNKGKEGSNGVGGAQGRKSKPEHTIRNLVAVVVALTGGGWDDGRMDGRLSHRDPEAVVDDVDDDRASVGWRRGGQTDGRGWLYGWNKL